ncbi:lipoyl synthase [Marispirochaeta aestuarii]|uniref:Lipoyl synthase n=1 Tax=Marispirochaeta aestuarii TaxID=1963862 RepID=A0A1Y1RV63_9SPIO|nr:lipoyl synthase [Marispirochaeta aestuarii]ORC33867.1 lipoyl synthase [Marispirochaeta aestuarii]
MKRSFNYTRKPAWIRMSLLTNRDFNTIKKRVGERSLTTVCEEARCPNIHECWGEHRTATFMILGDTCTRRCRFCAVKTGIPGEVDLAEPLRVARTISEMGAAHAVITMVNRDDLDDGGAAVMAATVRKVHELSPDCSVEVLSSDLMGDKKSLEIMMDAEPEIMSHNLETVRRLTSGVRSRSDYDRSLGFLRMVKEIDPQKLTKSSLMLGLGEEKHEVLQTMDDLRAVGVEIINLGQYLQPGRTNLPVVRYWEPEEFDELKNAALHRGFLHCESGPMVRSSYHAGDQYQLIRQRLLRERA